MDSGGLVSKATLVYFVISELPRKGSLTVVNRAELRLRGRSLVFPAFE